MVTRKAELFRALAEELALEILTSYTEDDFEEPLAPGHDGLSVFSTTYSAWADRLRPRHESPEVTASRVGRSWDTFRCDRVDPVGKRLDDTVQECRAIQHLGSIVELDIGELRH